MSATSNMSVMSNTKGYLMSMKCRKLWLFVAAVGLVVLSAGCDNTFDPFSEDAGLFSVYGYLSLSENRHFIRVKDLSAPPVPGSTRTIDATVTLENLDTGTKETLTDSLIAFDGVATHNFRSEQDIQPGAQYRLRIERSDGQSVETTATMPEFTEVQSMPSGTLGCVERATLRFTNVPSPRLLRVSVGVPLDDGRRWVDLKVLQDGPSGALVSRFGPSTLIRKIKSKNALRCVRGGPSAYCSLMTDSTLQVAYTHLGPDWPADTTSSPIESLESGIGVFGGIHRDTLRLTVPGTEGPPSLRCPLPTG